MTSDDVLVARAEDVQVTAAEDVQVTAAEDVRVASKHDLRVKQDDLVEVRWSDAQMTVGWTVYTDEDATDVLTVRSVGFWVGEYEDRVVLAQSVTAGDYPHGNIVEIPKGMVLSVTILLEDE